MDKSLNIPTTEQKQILDITDQVEEIVASSKTAQGVCLVFALHTTCSIMLGEYESGLNTDFINMFEQLKPKGPFHHAHDPDHAPSHLFSSMVGEQVLIPIKDGGLVLGTWQRIMLAEFDGPRSRHIVVQLIKG